MASSVLVCVFRRPFCFLLTACLLGVALAGPAAAQNAEPLTLDDAWAAALTDSDDLESLRAAVQHAEAAKRRALGAILPQLSLAATYRLNDEEVKLGDRVVKRQHDIFGSLRLEVGLFDGRAFPTFESAKQRIDIANLQLADLKQLVRLQVAQAYYTVLAAERMVDVSQGAVDARKEHHKSAQARLTAGHAVRLDVDRAVAAIHRAERDAIDARHQVLAARDTLALAIGREPPLNRPLVAPAPAAPVAGDALAVARAERNDLLALRGELQVAERSETATWLSFIPRLSLTGNLDFSQESFSSANLVTPSLTINLNWALYDGGVRYGQLLDDQAVIRSARAQLRKASRALAGEVSAAIRDLERGNAALAATEAERAAAQTALATARRAFSLGNAKTLDVLDAQLALEQAEASHIRESLLTDLARLRLRRAAGRL